jgi:ABC-2 type transport system permease protein
MVLPAYAYEEILRSKLFLVFLVLCLTWSFGLAVFLYVPHNLGLLNMDAFDLDPTAVKQFFTSLFDARFFYNWFMIPTFLMSLVVTIIVGPVLVTSDMRNNGLALYFSRPIRRSEYVVGKALVLGVLLSVITWIPGMLLFLFQSYLEGFGWMKQNYRIGVGILVGHAIWIVLLCLISLAISAYVKWKPVARLTLILVFIVAAFTAGMMNLLLGTDWASVINISDMMKVIWSRLFGLDPGVSTPLWVAILCPLFFCAASLSLLARKLRPYEVVK